MGCSARPRAVATLVFLTLGLARIDPAFSDGAAARAESDEAPADSNDAFTLDPIEVTAPRPANDPELRLRPGFARAYDLEGVRDLPRMANDVLAGAVGVHVRRFGGVGSQSTVSVRGSAPGQVAVYLDGVPLNSAEYGSVNLADFPLEALDRIEVYRSGAPIRFESPGGGVINLVGRAAQGSWARLSAGHGTFGTRQADAAGGWRRGRAMGLVVAQYLGSIGDFRFEDDNATPHNAEDDSAKTRVNNRLDSSAITARGEYGAGPITLDATFDLSSKSQGMPGTGANPALEAHLRGERTIANLRARWTGVGPSGAGIFARDPSVRVYEVAERDRFSDPAGELTGLRQENDDRTRRTGAQLEGAIRLPAAQTLALVCDARRERYSPEILLPAPRPLPGASRRVVAFGAEDLVSVLEDRVSVVGSYRRNAIEDEFPGGPAYPGALPSRPFDRIVRQSSWTAGARVGLTKLLAIKTSVSRLARAPTLEELFGNRGGIYGNPTARPEIVETRDAGLVLSSAPGGGGSGMRPGWLEAELSAYRSDAEDLIVFVQNSQRSSVAQNISAARLSGIELSGRAAWPGGFVADVSWTRQWTRDEGDVAYWRGKELPGRPGDEGSLFLSLNRAHWHTSYELHAISANYLDRYNASRVPSRTLHDVRVGVTPWGSLVEWFGEARNLTDRRAEDFAGFPLPGRTLYVGLRLHLDEKESS